MEIRNINSAPKFTGIYKFPNVDAKMMNNISEHMTFFANVTKSPVYLFSGRHPLENKVVEIILFSLLGVFALTTIFCVIKFLLGTPRLKNK